MLKLDLAVGNQVARGSKSDACKAKNSKFPSGPLTMIRGRKWLKKSGRKKRIHRNGMMNRKWEICEKQGAYEW